ncbi:hypothetical protein LCGC14_0702460 [marine sediment metagenome]|uniref:Uncharacterized protein n=1 Tax=marine sediment metagenome TaxID=412755 RepID=A0A0F9TQ64_9ZZZZ
MKEILHIITKVNPDGLILQELKEYGTHLQEGERVLMRSIIDTREEQVRKALIELGWTPPQEEGT